MKKKLHLPKEEVTEIFFKIITNHHEMFAVTVGNVGYGIFLSLNASTVKHSCIPNVARKFNGKELTLKAVDKIDNFSEVGMIYATFLSQQDVKFRRFHLKRQYCFTCHCKFCDDEDLESMMESSMLCSCGGCIPVSKMICVDCNLKVSSEKLEKLVI